MSLSTHVLDTALGRPAADVVLALFERKGEHWHEVARGVTDTDGRCRTLLADSELVHADYRLRFEIAPYFSAGGSASLYPFVEIAFTVRTPEQHYHIPLLMTANGYSTYRGS